MNKDCEEQVEHTIWINKEEQIVTFREAEGFEKIIFQPQEDKMAYAYILVSAAAGFYKEGLSWQKLIVERLVQNVQKEKC